MRPFCYLKNLTRQAVNIRYCAVLIIVYFILDIYIVPLRNYAQDVGGVISFANFSFILASNYASKIIFLCVLYYYSNVPFLEPQEQYFLVRMGRFGTCIKNYAYIVISSLLLTVSMWLVSFLSICSNISFENSWGSLDKTVAFTKLGNELGNFYGIYGKALERYSPYELFGHVFLLQICAKVFVGSFLYVISMMFYRSVALFSGAVVIMLPDAIKYITFSYYFSPLSWMQCDSWRYGYDGTMPDLVYCYVGYLFLIFIMMQITLYYMKKRELFL